MTLARKAAMEKRENDLLDIIYNNGDTFAIVVYGARHNWKNNIYEWNIKNPANKFSHVIIVPQLLKPYLSLALK